jgi:hypothetical protein
VRQRRKRYIIIFIAIAFLYLISTIFGALRSEGGKSSRHLAAVVGSKISTASQTPAKEESACDNRPPASGDVYVRTVTPKTPPQAQQLRGEWRWDNAARKCLTPVQLVIDTAPQSAGNCTQIGYVKDNSGYKSDVSPAPLLSHVVAQAGPACAAKAKSIQPRKKLVAVPPPTTPAAPPLQTTPVAAPPQTTPPAPAPASTAPASCYPLSNEGNCYEPGEYCRDSDHGVSGVAGDGEAIMCEDNDGWRWESA